MMVNSQQELSQVKFISKYFVKPKYASIANPQHNPHYYLGPMDLGLLSLNPMQKGLLFSTQTTNYENDGRDQVLFLLEKLNKSLALCLAYFYPLAGQLATQKFPNEHASLIYVDCNNGPGACLIHASVDLSVSNILSSIDVHPIVRSFFDLGEKQVNHDGHTKPLLSIQVTELLDGAFIGFTMNHSLGDGTSLCHFIASLSEIFLGLDTTVTQKYSCSTSSNLITSRPVQANPQLDTKTSNNRIPISQKPVYKPYFPAGYGPILKLPYLETNEFITRFDPGLLRERIFHFSPSSMAKLKAIANEECGVDNMISSFQALCGLLWKSITRARELEPEMETACSLIINTRPRFDPPLSQDYFGNYLCRAAGTCRVSELIGHGIGQAAMLLNKGLKAKDDKAIREYFLALVKAPYVAQPGTTSKNSRPNNILISGSARFNMYGPEFGLGRAMAVLAGYPNKEDGKVTATPGRGGGGSVDLEVCLDPKTMSALESDEDFMRYLCLV